MATNWSEWQTFGAWAAVLVAGGGFLIIFRQLKIAAEQSRLEAHSTLSNLYSHVSDAMDRVNHRLLAQPELIPYFYENVPLPSEDRLLQRQADLVCETILDMADSIVEQRRARPEDVDWSTWYAYFRWLQNNGPVLRSFFYENIDFYPDYLFAVFGRIHVRDEARGEMASRYQAWEFAPPEGDDATVETDESAFLQEWLGLRADKLPPRGYPWVRTWLFYLVDEETGEVRERGDTPAMIADVDVTSWKYKHEDAAIVRLIVPNEESEHKPSDMAVQVVKDWILQTFDRTGIRWVEFNQVSTKGPTWPDTPRKKCTDLTRKDLALQGPRYFGRPSPLPSRKWPWSRAPRLKHEKPG